MTIEITRKTPYLCAYTIKRKDNSAERFELDAKTYFLHDICHYVVEKNLAYSKGFWGMLSGGHSLNELFGKENPETEELRFIEQIVGPVQSVYSGHMPKHRFAEHTGHIGFTAPDGFLDSCLDEITDLMNKWRDLPVGKQLTLEWK